MNKGLIFSILALLIVGCGKQVTKDIPQPIPQGPQHSFINGPLTPGGNVTDQFAVTPNSQKVVYIADETTMGIKELYVSNIDGTNRIKLSQPLIIGDEVIRFKIAPDSQKVAYIAKINGLQNLYTINLDATQRFMVNQGVPTSAYTVPEFYWLNTSTRLAYTCDELNPLPAGNFGLYEADFNGANRMTLSADTVAPIFSVSQNGARIVYRKGTLVNPNLRSVKVDGTSDVLLNTPFDLVANPSSGINSFIISPSSALVAYRSNQETSNKSELYIVNIDGSGAKTKVSGTIVANGNVGQYSFSTDSTKILFVADKDTDGVNELYTNTVSNAGTLKLSGSTVLGSNVLKFQALANDKIAFIGDMNVDGVNELFVTDYTGSFLNRMNSSLVPGEQVVDFSSDGIHIAYLMDSGNAGKFSVYSNSVAGGQERMVSQPLAGGPGAYDSTSSSSRQVVLFNGKIFYRSGVSSGNYQGYRVSIAGGDIETLTNEATGGSMLLAGVSSGSSIVVTPDGNYFVYRMNISGAANLLSSVLR